MTSTLGHLKHKTNIIWVSIINIDLSVDYLLILQVFIFSHFDWICCNRTQGVCVCVCLCVCASVCLCVSSLQPKRMNRFWWNFTQMILSIFASVIFRGFWNFEFDDVIAAILHLRVAALSRSQFWSDFLQILIQEAHNSCIVWYWKSARSINNFRSKKLTAFESHRCLRFRARLRGHGFESQRGQTFAFCFFVILNVICYERSQNRLNDWICYNTLVFLFFFSIDRQ